MTRSIATCSEKASHPCDDYDTLPKRMLQQPFYSALGPPPRPPKPVQPRDDGANRSLIAPWTSVRTSVELGPRSEWRLPFRPSSDLSGPSKRRRNAGEDGRPDKPKDPQPRDPGGKSRRARDPNPRDPGT